MRVYDLALYRDSRSRKQEKKPLGQIRFSRLELRVIMAVYFRNVVAGTWRDYGISYLHDKVVFSIFRNSSGSPIYQLEKFRKKNDRNDQYLIRTSNGRILRQGHRLDNVIRVLDCSQFNLVS